MHEHECRRHDHKHDNDPPEPSDHSCSADHNLYLNDPSSDDNHHAGSPNKRLRSWPAHSG